MIRIEMKICSMILTEKHKKYLYFFQVKLVYINILQAKKYYFFIKVKWLKKLSLHTLFLKKTVEKQIKTIGSQREQQINAIEEHGKQLTKSNAFAKKEISEQNKLKAYCGKNECK